METIIEILSGLHPEIDFLAAGSLIDGGVLDSFDIVTIVAEINDKYDITVPPEEISPENFNSAKALHAMVVRLCDE